MSRLGTTEILIRYLRRLSNLNFHKSAHSFQTTNIMNSKKVVQERWEDKMKFWMKKYEDLFGITKLAEMHEKVIEIQTKVTEVQEKRRKIQEEIFAVQKKLQEMQDILHKTSMGDDMYISVVTQVRELLKEQKRLHDVFSLYDQTEREQQTSLAIAINNSQDHERTYREKNKYLSLITGIVGGILGLVGSSVNNWRHRKDIKLFALDISDQVTALKNSIDKINLIFLKNDKVLKFSQNEENEAQDLLSTLKLQHELLEKNVKSLQSLVKDKILNNLENEGLYMDFQVKKMLNQFEENIDNKLKYHSSLNIGLLSTVLIFCTFTFYIANRH